MQRVIGGPASGMKADNRIDKTAFIQHPSDRPWAFPLAADGDSPLPCFNIQRMAQITMGVFKRRPGQMQPHDFHQHLVGIGRAVESTRARAVIGFGFGLQ